MLPLFLLLLKLFIWLHIPSEGSFYLSCLVCFVVAGKIAVVASEHDVFGKIQMWWHRKSAKIYADKGDEVTPAFILLGIIPAYLTWLLLDGIGIPHYLAHAVNSVGMFFGFYISEGGKLKSSLSIVDFLALWLVWPGVTKRIIKRLFSSCFSDHSAYCARIANAKESKTINHLHSQSKDNYHK